MTTAVKQNPVQPILSTPYSGPLAWFTPETALVAAIALAALALRLWDLGLFPLSNAESEQALAAWAIYHGREITAPGYSPLLASLNALAFLLLNDSNGSARLAAALLGTALALLPFTLRRQLGPKVCLLTAGLLAVSPTAVFLSRTSNGEIATALGALLLVSGFFNWIEAGQQRWLYALAGGAALLLTSGPLAYPALIIFGLMVLGRWSAFKALAAQGRQQMAQRGLLYAGLFLLATFLLLATAGTFNLSGLGVTTGLLADWLGRLGLQPRPEAGFNAVFLLTIYEPLLILAGFAGLAYALLSRSVLRQSFVGWFLGALTLDLLLAGRPFGAVALAVVPLAFLAAIALAALWDSLIQAGSWSNEGIIVGAGLVIAVFGYIGLTGWLVRPCAENDNFCRMAWIQPVAAFWLFLVIALFFGYMTDLGVTVRGAALTGAIVGVMIMVSLGWRLNHGPLSKQAFQPLAGHSPSIELVGLAQTLASESLIRTGDNATLDISLVGNLPPAIHWLVRGYKNTQQRGLMLEAAGASAIITPNAESADPNLGEAYVGQDFTISPTWSPAGLVVKDLVYWLVYRELPLHPQGDKVILWLRANQPHY